MNATVGIRREEKSWERRAPLVPADVKYLIAKHGLKIQVQSSTPQNSRYARVFTDDEYRQAGAEIVDDLAACDVVLAVKEIPLQYLQADRTYVYFSHTIKGQPYNMPMLQHLMTHRCNLIDYETVTNDNGSRLIFFGKYAGMAGMIDSLWALGKRLQAEGYDTPLAHVKLTHEYDDFAEATAALKTIGQELIDTGIPVALRPFVIGIAGYGNVSQGAQLVFSHFPTIKVTPQELLTLSDQKENAIYEVIFKEEDTVKPRDPQQPFELDDYFANPEKYESQFYQYVPHLTMLLNCIYWTEQNPRLITKQEFREYYRDHSHDRNGLRVIGDISCDIDGAIQATQKATKPDNPVYVYHPEDETMTDGYEGHGPVIMAVDNLPCELSREASETFSAALRDFVPALANADFQRNFDDLDLPPELKRAMIVHRGQLTPAYAYIETHLG